MAPHLLNSILFNSSSKSVNNQDGVVEENLQNATKQDLVSSQDYISQSVYISDLGDTTAARGELVSQVINSSHTFIADHGDVTMTPLSVQERELEEAADSAFGGLTSGIMLTEKSGTSELIWLIPAVIGR